jgi:PAS domain S-box-containing protein
MSKTAILIVEDEGIVAKDLAHKLETLGYEVAGIAESGEESIELAQQLQPDLILMDIWLKGPMDGIEAAETIQRIHHVPIIYLTAHSDPATLARAKITEPFGYILKPFRQRELTTQIEMALYRHTAERQLREQREWYRVTLASIGDAVIATDANGRITFMNPIAEFLTGWPLDQALGQPVHQVFSIIDERTGDPLDVPVCRMLQENQPMTLENYAALINRDGNKIPIEDTAAPILDSRGRTIGTILVFHDVTKKRRVAEALRASEKKYRNLFKNMAEQVYFWKLVRDEHGEIKTWRLMDINPPALMACGKRRQDVLGKTVNEVFPNEITRFMPIVQKIMAEGVPYSYEIYSPELDQHLRLTSVPLGEYFITTGADISEIKKADRILQESNAELERRVTNQTAKIRRGYAAVQAERQRLFDVLETLPVMICLLTSDFQVAFANRSFREKFGESHGRHCYEYCFDLTEPCSFCKSSIVLKTGRSHHWEVTVPDGNRIDVYDFPFVDTDKEKMILKMSIDITDRTKAEKELRKAHEELGARAAQLRNLAAELTFAEQRERNRLAIVLHDGLQQTLVAAKFHLALVDQSEETAKTITMVTNLIDDCIDTSRSLSAELSPPIYHRGGLIPALEWLVQWMGDKHGLVVKLTSKNRRIPLPEEITVLLFQSVRELLFNIVKHSATRKARVRVTQSNEQIQVEVADKGAGFDSKHIENLVNRMGTGMGLFSIRERLGYLGGTMEIDATPGQGARFTLIVPVETKPKKLQKYPASSKPSGALSASSTSTKGDGEKIRVALVDDHLVMRQGLASLLGVQKDILIVGEASDGKSAIDLVRNTRPDVVLMDIGMPELDGIETTRRIHEQMPEIKIIGLSMHEGSEHAAAIIAAGAVKYLTKSGPSEALLNAIRSCL